MRTTLPLQVRFWQRVDTSRGAMGCWIWTGSLTDRGYGDRVWLDDGTRQAPHRVAYELLVGPIPDGLVIDHLCRTRNCVNPHHLEPVTCRENLMRGETLAAQNWLKTHCVNGHAFTKENTRITPDGHRACRTCARENARAVRAQKREQQQKAAS